MSLCLVLFLQYGLLLIIAFGNGVCDEHEYRLTKHLLDRYDAGVRPAKNSSQPLVVVFGLSLHHIIDVSCQITSSIDSIGVGMCGDNSEWSDMHIDFMCRPKSLILISHAIDAVCVCNLAALL
ncbi:hypothetical protein EAG_14854 [Camponotus floridanus]|uniref:Neurotransmitter-gated ion-channel ligand-binding domain-containing protein n=1 Tax=Camponotus floridanus TaxID=104421 RepID=E2A4Q2_CAMFO|nr:hypothetical protein EAG_14854 [Camponotus floridanus]